MATTTTISGAGGEDRVMATAQQIVKSLDKEVAEDMMMIFSSFDKRLSNITDVMTANGAVKDDHEIDGAEERFDAAEKVIHRWDAVNSEASRNSLLWEESPDEAAEYLSAVDEILRLTEDLNFQSDGSDFLGRADSALQLAMSRLEDEFRHILVRNTVPLDAERLYGSIRRVSPSFATNVVEFVDEFGSFGEDDHQGSGYCHKRGASLEDDVCVDLINQDAVVELEEIADRMIKSGYERECCQVYISVRRDVLDECLSILGVEKLSIEEVQKMEWKSLDEKVKKWIQAVKIAFRVLLPGEKRLCDQIFYGSDLIKETCFNETSKSSVMQLLNFGEAISLGKRSSEKLFRILDMYDALASVLPNFEALFGDDESGEFVCREARGVLGGLGKAAKGTFVEFEYAVKNETSKKPMQGGEIHPLTRYVMNYVKLLADYSDSLNSILENGEGNELDHLQNEDDENSSDSGSMSPIGRRLLLLISSLELNLEEKSKLYEELSMQYVFSMNNNLYIVQKVKDSELGKLLGDQWIRKRKGQIRQYATSYLRSSWTKVLSCLKDEGIGGGSSSIASRMALKERFKSFNASFEDIYRVQTAWKVPDDQLREELRISISEMLIPAYRAFMGRFGNQLENGRHAGKYMKYTPEDLENYLSDFFEGSPTVLHHPRRKST